MPCLFIMNANAFSIYMIYRRVQHPAFFLQGHFLPCLFNTTGRALATHFSGTVPVRRTLTLTATAGMGVHWHSAWAKAQPALHYCHYQITIIIY
jgi:hypothetical protein